MYVTLKNMADKNARRNNSPKTGFVKKSLNEILTGNELRVLNIQTGQCAVLTPELLKAGFRAAALAYHPDKGGSNEQFTAMTEMFPNILAALKADPRGVAKFCRTDGMTYAKWKEFIRVEAYRQEQKDTQEEVKREEQRQHRYETAAEMRAKMRKDEQEFRARRRRRNDENWTRIWEQNNKDRLRRELEREARDTKKEACKKRDAMRSDKYSFGTTRAQTMSSKPKCATPRPSPPPAKPARPSQPSRPKFAPPKQSPVSRHPPPPPPAKPAPPSRSPPPSRKPCSKIELDRMRLGRSQFATQMAEKGLGGKSYYMKVLSDTDTLIDLRSGKISEQTALSRYASAKEHAKLFTLRSDLAQVKEEIAAKRMLADIMNRL